jgi:hypothetical protein
MAAGRKHVTRAPRLAEGMSSEAIIDRWRDGRVPVGQDELDVIAAFPAAP